MNIEKIRELLKDGFIINQDELSALNSMASVDFMIKACTGALSPTDIAESINGIILKSKEKTQKALAETEKQEPTELDIPTELWEQFVNIKDPDVANIVDDVRNYIENLESENERYEEAFRRLQNWAKAYPLEVFPKLDFKKAAKVLKANGMTLDSISADNMRHVLNGIKNIVEQALKGE